MSSSEGKLRAAFSENPTLARLIVSTCGLNVPLSTISNLALCYEPFHSGNEPRTWLKKHVREFLLKHFVTSDDSPGFLKRTQIEGVSTWPVGPESYGAFGRKQNASFIGLDTGPVDKNACELIVNQFFKQSGTGKSSKLSTKQIRTTDVMLCHVDCDAADVSPILDALEIVGLADSEDAEARAKTLLSEQSVSLSGFYILHDPEQDHGPTIRANVSANLAQGAIFASYLKRHGLGVSLHPVERAPGRTDSLAHGNHRLRWKVRFIQEDFYDHLSPVPRGYGRPKFSTPKEPTDELEAIAVSWTDLIDLNRTDYPSKEWLTSLLHERMTNIVKTYSDRQGIDEVEVW